MAQDGAGRGPDGAGPAAETIQALSERLAGEWLSGPGEPAERLAEIVSAVSRAVAGAIESGSVDPADLRSCLRARLGLTDTCVMAALFLQAQELTPFEFSIWLAGGR